MGSLIVITLLAALAAVVSAQTHTIILTNGVELFDKVWRNGARRGNCTYFDRNRAEITVRISKQRGGRPHYTLINWGDYKDYKVDPALAFTECERKALQSVGDLGDGMDNKGVKGVWGVDGLKGDKGGITDGILDRFDNDTLELSDPLEAMAVGVMAGADSELQARKGGGGSRLVQNRKGTDGCQPQISSISDQIVALQRENLQIQQDLMEIQEQNVEIANRLREELLSLARNNLR